VLEKEILKAEFFCKETKSGRQKGQLKFGNPEFTWGFRLFQTGSLRSFFHYCFAIFRVQNKASRLLMMRKYWMICCYYSSCWCCCLHWTEPCTVKWMVSCEGTRLYIHFFCCRRLSFLDIGTQRSKRKKVNQSWPSWKLRPKNSVAFFWSHKKRFFWSSTMARNGLNLALALELRKRWY